MPGYVAEGLGILAGRQKLGKTWLALDWAIAVASGGVAMGSIACEQGDVLYIDLENGHRRIQARINTLFPDERRRPDLSRLEWVNDAPALNKGFLDALDDWRLSVRKPRLVDRRRAPARQASRATRTRTPTRATTRPWRASALGDRLPCRRRRASPYPQRRRRRSA